jgi:hypothetical protein
MRYGGSREQIQQHLKRKGFNMLTTPEQTNKNQTASFPRTATAHQSAINTTLKVPINTNFLEQTPRVDELLQVALKAAGYIGEDTIRNELLMVLQALTMERTVCTFQLVTVMLAADKMELKITTEEALQILNSAIVDVKINYASEAINYHLTQLLAEKEA